MGVVKEHGKFAKREIVSVILTIDIDSPDGCYVSLINHFITRLQVPQVVPASIDRPQITRLTRASDHKTARAQTNQHRFTIFDCDVLDTRW